jgi:molybdenum cofactor cytidylyltransferase
MAAEPRLGVILPAAGGSTRLGRPKQLLELSGEPLVARAARLAVGLAPACTVIVTGAHAAAVGRAVHALPVVTVQNDEWRDGLGGSIAVGARALADDVDAALVMLCDQWRLQVEDLQGLLAHWREGDGISAARHGGLVGPPVIFSSHFLPELRGLRGESGARSVITANEAACSCVEMPNAAHDLDTPMDLAAMEHSFAGGGPDSRAGR